MGLQIIEISAVEAGQYLPKVNQARGEKYFKLTCDGETVLCFAAWKNYFHKKNTYIQPYFLKEETGAKILFAFMKDYFKSPLQCMLPSGDKRVPILKRGGFKLARRCFDREFTKADLKSKITGKKENIAEYVPTNKEYNDVCKFLYETYAKNHERINPLTAGLDAFCADLPQTVYCAKNGFAFIEENEICYVGGSGDLKNFFASVLDKIFSEYQSVVFEADDVDKAAMQLKDMFNDNCGDSFDTYIFE